MSQEARIKLCAAMQFQRLVAKRDLLDQYVTSTYLIGLLDFLVFRRGWPIEILYAVTDHHNDGPNGHYGGKAVDCYLLNDPTEGDWADPKSARFVRFLTDCAVAPYVRQIGLGGDTQTPENYAAIGKLGFTDSNQDHIHLGVQL